MMINRLRLLIFKGYIIPFLFIFLWAPTKIIALNPNKMITQYDVQVWNIETGQPWNSVYAIQQTQDGYLWIGTGEGLVRFDGIDFELYDQQTVPQLKHNVIRALYEDRKGTLWIGTDSGGLTRYQGGVFTTYTIPNHNALEGIRAINEDRWGNLWIGSITKGLTCLRGDKFTTYTTKEGLPHNQVNFIYRDGNGDLWVTTLAGIVKLLEPGVFQSYAVNEVIPHFKYVCLFEEDTKELWIGTAGGGLIRLKNGIFTAYRHEAGIPHHIITYLYRDRRKNLWIGTDGGGLTRMVNGVISTLSVDQLASGSVYSIYEDREGSLWLGTVDGGLHQLKDSKFTTYTIREGLAHDTIYCIYVGRAGDLWVGTKGGLSRLKNGTFTTLLTTKEGLINDNISGIFEDHTGELWIGTFAGGHRYKDGKLSTFTSKDGLSDDSITFIQRDRGGNIWIGTRNGLNRFNRSTGTFTVFTTEQGLLSNFIIFAFKDSRGNLWIGTDNGLNCLREGVLTVSTSATGHVDKNFHCAYEDKGGTLWFGTYSGLIRLKGKQTSLYTVQCGLVENYIYTVLEDEKGYLWLAGRNGVSRVKKKELEDFSKGLIDRVHPDTFNEKDGMKSRFCTGPGCRTRDGKFWFPTVAGVSMIDPIHIKKNDLPPSLNIKKLLVDGEPVHIHAGPGRKKPVKLAPGKKRLEFHYTAVSFINPQRVKFKLKLEGYDRDWVDMGNLRTSSYAGLPPGQYTFKVIACNSDGVWNKKGASLSFYLRPYFYQTFWFFLLIALSIIAAGFLLHHFRVRQLQSREKELGEQVDLRTKDLKERTIELENAQQKLQQSKELIEAKNRQLQAQSKKLQEMDRVKSRFFANISHEFRTPLTLIMGPLEQILSDSRDSELKGKANLMLRNSRRLLNLINQLLDLSKFESGKMKLQASQQNIVPFLKGIISSFDSLAAQNEIDLVFITESEDISLYYDAEKIEKAVNNLLINAIKFTPHGGKVTTSLKVSKKPSPGFLEISVKDTGIGIPAEKLEHIFDRFYQAEGLSDYSHKGSGIGLALTKELLLLHHGEINVQSEEGKGSEFSVRLPLGKAHLKPAQIARQPEKPSGYEVQRDTADFSLVDEHEEEPEITDRIEAPGPEKNIILVVEDNADVRQYIKEPLLPLYQVVEAKDGEKGIKKAREVIPDLIISDIMMPKVDGYELCKTLKQDIKTSHIPIILLTAKASEESIISGLESGADDYITKPFSTKILNVRIKNLIDLRRHLQQTISREMTLQPSRLSVSKLDQEFLKELQETIEEYLSDTEFNVEELRRKLYMSGASLYRKIYALSGESPSDFIRSYRLKRAAQLLKSGAGSVTEVAFEVGFSSRAYFTKCFKEKFHQLPSDYQAAEAE